MSDTIRVIVAFDVPAEQLAEVYNLGTLHDTSSPHAADLQDTLAARLNEIYPANDGYATPSNVVAAVVNDDTPLYPSTLQGIYEVGVEGVEVEEIPACKVDGCDNVAIGGRNDVSVCLVHL